MDGTLLDTEAVHRRAMAQAGSILGHHVTDEVLLAMVGIHREENSRMLAAHFGPHFPLEQFYAESDALFEAALEAGIALRPGTELVLEHIARANIPMAVATSTHAPFAQQRLAAAGIRDYFDVVVTRDDVVRPKPDPEPYLRAAALLGVNPGEAIAVEDSHVGVRSATAAGIATVMVPDLLPPTEELTLAVAHVLPSLADLAELLRETPSFQGSGLINEPSAG